MPIKIAIADDNPIHTESLCLNLSLFDEIEVLFSALNGKDLLAKIKINELPQVILMDIEMPLMCGIQATIEVLNTVSSDIKIIMLTAFEQDDKVFEAIKAGAAGYLLKGESPSKIVSSIKDVLAGQSPMSASIATKILAIIRETPIQFTEKTPEKSPQDFELTKREIEILDHVTKGSTYKQIADLLYVSDKTIKKHIENIYQKLHINSKYEAMQLALKYNW
jgi:DNA-binding NarL/FixJ family response regulator